VYGRAFTADAKYEQGVPADEESIYMMSSTHLSNFKGFLVAERSTILALKGS
jgi:hypothetical protein